MNSVLDLLRQEMDETFPTADANGKIILPAANLGIKEVEGKRYVRFKFGAKVLTKAAIDRAAAARKITVDWSPVLVDADNKPVLDAENKPTVLPEVHVTLLDQNVVIETDNNFVGFGVRGRLVTAAELY